MTVYKLGASWDYSDTCTWRAGISTTDQPIPKGEMTFNILAPGVMEEHYTVGFTQKLDSGNEVNLSFMYAPEAFQSAPARCSEPAFSCRPWSNSPVELVCVSRADPGHETIVNYPIFQGAMSGQRARIRYSDPAVPRVDSTRQKSVTGQGSGAISTGVSCADFPHHGEMGDIGTRIRCQARRAAGFPQRFHKRDELLRDARRREPGDARVPETAVTIQHQREWRAAQHRGAGLECRQCGIGHVTQEHQFDPIVAIAVALNILWSGAHLMYRSVGGLMDYADPDRTSRVQAAIEPLGRDLGFAHHGLRVRNTGYRTLVEVHLLFPFAVTLGDAHRRATVLEQHIAKALDEEVAVVTHLESLEDHAAVHLEAH